MGNCSVKEYVASFKSGNTSAPIDSERELNSEDDHQIKRSFKGMGQRISKNNPKADPNVGFLNAYKVGKQIGVGMYGEVRICQHIENE